MQLRTVLLASEAVILGGPTTVLAAYGLPWLLSMAVITLTENPLLGAKALVQLLGAIYAVFEFWRLAHRTVLKRPYNFGLPFALACIGAFSFGIELQGWSSSILAGLLVALPGCAVAHFSLLQLTTRSKWHVAQQSLPAEQSASRPAG